MDPLVAPALDAYAERHTSELAPLFNDLREETFRSAKAPQMQVGKVEGTFLKLLVKLSGAKQILEIGMFTGYSALMMAEGLPDDGHLVTCDVNPEVEKIARAFFAKSPHGRKIEVRMGPALDTIQTLKGPLDLVFIDADKENYPQYYDAVLPLLKPGGLLVADNVLWSGKVVAEAKSQDAETRALVTFSDKVQADARVENVLLTVRDGMMLVRKT